MKKIISIALCAVMLFSLAACGSNNSFTADADAANGVVTILENIWSTYEEDDMFYAMGGDYTNIVDNAPGTVDLTAVEDVDALLHYPADSIALVDDAASLIHGMNRNTFTAGVYHVVNADDLEGLADTLKDYISSTQWICGFPETLIIVKLGNNVLLTAWGAADTVETFKTNTLSVYSDAVVLYEGNLE